VVELISVLLIRDPVLFRPLDPDQGSETPEKSRIIFL
jgi:hypothetical protein